MGRRSGFCASQTHHRCHFLTTNGARASSRYVICTCDCHDGDERARDTVTAAMAHWNTEPLDSTALTDITRFVDATNAIIGASLPGEEPRAQDDDTTG